MFLGGTFQRSSWPHDMLQHSRGLKESSKLIVRLADIGPSAKGRDARAKT